MAIMSQVILPHVLDSMSPEMALLVACARSQLTEEHKSVIRSLLDKELDWDSVINNAIYHKVIPLLHRSLSTSFHNQVPAGAMNRITTHLKESSLYTFVISASQLNVISLLLENGIPVLPVKGAMLAEKLYGSTTMRTYTDVDILVLQKDIEQSLNLLLKNSYTLLPEGISQSTYLNFLKYNHHGRLRDKNGILIELHWELSGFYASVPMTLESLEPFLIKTEFNNCPTLDLTNEMLFIFLCLHGNKHRWKKLDDICSIAELMAKPHGLDWQLILEFGRKHKMIKRILLTLSLTKKLFGATIPTQIEKMISSGSTINRLADKVIDTKINQHKEDKTTHPFQKSISFHMSVMDSKLDAIRFILRPAIFPEHEDWHHIKPPGRLFFLYFLYKPSQVLWLLIINRIKSMCV